MLKPDNGNSVVVLYKIAYDRDIPSTITYTSKFRVIDNDPDLLRKGKLQQFLRALKVT